MIQSPVLDLVMPVTKQFEANAKGTFSPTAFKDQDGMDIGWGHRLMVNDPLLNAVITAEQADDLLHDDLDRQNTYLAACLGDQWMDLGFGQQAALIDFCYNLGIGRFENSTLHSYVVWGRNDSVPTELNKWVYVGHPPTISPWQVKRRAAEVALWNWKPAA